MIGTAIVQCAKTVRAAGLLEVEEVGDAEEWPKWSQVPKECKFKTQRIGSGAQQHWATPQEQKAQCREYGKFRRWAIDVCGLEDE